MIAMSLSARGALHLEHEPEWVFFSVQRTEVGDSANNIRFSTSILIRLKYPDSSALSSKLNIFNYCFIIESECRRLIALRSTGLLSTSVRSKSRADPCDCAPVKFLDIAPCHQHLAPYVQDTGYQQSIDPEHASRCNRYCIEQGKLIGAAAEPAAP